LKQLNRIFWRLLVKHAMSTRICSLATTLLLMAFVVFSADYCQAQATTGQFVGQVTDTTGAVLTRAGLTPTP
jgi:hypothetical protein